MSKGGKDFAGKRRIFLKQASRVAMAGGLVAGYGTFAGVSARFLYPAAPDPGAWMYVARVGAIAMGESLVFTAPGGRTAIVARQGEGDGDDSFIALSSVCPHLGCQVHWEPQNDRFFCPCHNGVFTPEGTAVEGPPAKAKQSLLRYPLKVENGLLFVQMPVGKIA